MPNASDGYSLEEMERWRAKALDNIERLREGIRREEEAIKFADRVIGDLRSRAEPQGKVDGVPV